MIFKRSIFIYSKDEKQIKETYEQLFTIDLVSTSYETEKKRFLRAICQRICYSKLVEIRPPTTSSYRV